MQTPRHIPINVSGPEASDKANIFVSLTEYKLNRPLQASHLVGYQFILKHTFSQNGTKLSTELFTKTTYKIQIGC